MFLVCFSPAEARSRTKSIYPQSDFHSGCFLRDDSVGNSSGAVDLQTERHLTPLFCVSGRQHAAEHGAVRGQEAEEAGPESVSVTPQTHRNPRRAPVLSRTASADESALIRVFVSRPFELFILKFHEGSFTLTSG